MDNQTETNSCSFLKKQCPSTSTFAFVQPSNSSQNQNNPMQNILSSSSIMIQTIQLHLQSQEKSLQHLTDLQFLAQKKRQMSSPKIQQVADFVSPLKRGDSHEKNNQKQEKSGTPQLLDGDRTTQIRRRNFQLKQVIQDTIELLLTLYKSQSDCKENCKNIDAIPTESNRKGVQSQILERLSFIFCQMNQLNDEIHSTIQFLNQQPSATIIKSKSTHPQDHFAYNAGTNLGKNLFVKTTPFKQKNYHISEQSEKSQQEQSNELQPEQLVNEQKDNEQDRQVFSPHENGNISLEQRMNHQRGQQDDESMQQQFSNQQ